MAEFLEARSAASRFRPELSRRPSRAGGRRALIEVKSVAERRVGGSGLTQVSGP
jgi:hypothetical protein